MPVSGVAGIRYVPGNDEKNDVHLRQKIIRVTLKGADEHGPRGGRKAATAIDR